MPTSMWPFSGPIRLMASSSRTTSSVTLDLKLVVERSVLMVYMFESPSSAVIGTVKTSITTVESPG